MTDRLPQTSRADAVENRERILNAGRALFFADGLDVPMREVARRAGVGPATLYRHFPSKQALVTEAFADQLHACRVVVDEGCADPDPWRGLCLVIEKICELHAHDQGFTEALLATYPGVKDVSAGREYTVGAVAELAQRAKAAGRLRPDFVLDDLILMLMANKGIRATSTATRVKASRRFSGLVIRAFEALPAARTAPASGTTGINIA
ncbi:TetR/AcrR family transcriptional regulator [Streptomyces sp. NPDC049936]|uniref:TetR/AcrR family transcriptional regulator n=1 Tax=Streptomyces sp. NPDC049936 TaxID=3365599 RepID=UPI0037AFBE5F